MLISYEPISIAAKVVTAIPPAPSRLYYALLLRFLCFFLSKKMINKLLCSTSCKPTMRNFPFASLQKKLILRHCNSVTLCQRLNDSMEFFSVWCAEIDTLLRNDIQEKVSPVRYQRNEYHHLLRLPVLSPALSLTRWRRLLVA